MSQFNSKVSTKRPVYINHICQFTFRYTKPYVPPLGKEQPGRAGRRGQGGHRPLRVTGAESPDLEVPLS